jgi:hypothetical protein
MFDIILLIHTGLTGDNSMFEFSTDKKIKNKINMHKKRERAEIEAPLIQIELAKEYPLLFNLDAPVPVEIGICEKLKKKLDKKSPNLLKEREKLNLFFLWWCNRPEYCECFWLHKFRVNLNGSRGIKIKHAVKLEKQKILESIPKTLQKIKNEKIELDFIREHGIQANKERAKAELDKIQLLRAAKKEESLTNKTQPVVLSVKHSSTSPMEKSKTPIIIKKKRRTTLSLP